MPALRATVLPLELKHAWTISRGTSSAKLNVLVEISDGALVGPASFIAEVDNAIVGVILITLLPGGDATDWNSYHWDDIAPADLWEQHQGQPHLTWILVSRFAQGTGIGTRLLYEAVQVLRRQGYKTLWTTFLLGNDSSQLWHWRNGFELLPHGLSKRHLKMTR